MHKQSLAAVVPVAAAVAVAAAALFLPQPLLLEVPLRLHRVSPHRVFLQLQQQAGLGRSGALAPPVRVNPSLKAVRHSHRKKRKNGTKKTKKTQLVYDWFV